MMTMLSFDLNSDMASRIYYLEEQVYDARSISESLYQPSFKSAIAPDSFISFILFTILNVLVL